MTVRERVLALRLLEKQKKNPELAKKLGINVKIVNKAEEKKNQFNKENLIMKTAEDFIKEMENSNVLMSNECTFKEYVSEITQFQDIICKMIAGDNYHEGMRIDEASFIMESIARKKGLRNHPAVHNGVLTMKKLTKEMAITMSGAKGENLVSRTLEFLDRPNTQIFHNVYISDGIDETELDGVVLTDSGIIILEIKKVKSDLTLTEDGRMVFAGDECYDKIPLAQKMALKRRLLKKCLEKIIADKGLDIPVYVDSFIVFSTPKGQYIKIEDKYRHEKYCFRTRLNKKIENHLGCAYYKEEQLGQLGEVFSEMESNVKRFETELNYNEVRRSLAEAFTVLQDVPVSKEHPVNKSETNIQHKNTIYRQQKYKTVGLGYAVASIFAGVLISGTALLKMYRPYK